MSRLAAAESGWSGRVFRAESVTVLPLRDGGAPSHATL